MCYTIAIKPTNNKPFVYYIFSFLKITSLIWGVQIQRERPEIRIIRIIRAHD